MIKVRWFFFSILKRKKMHGHINVISVWDRFLKIYNSTGDKIKISVKFDNEEVIEM